MEWRGKWDIERVLAANGITEEDDLDVDDLIDICESYGIRMSNFEPDDINWDDVRAYADSDDD